MTHLRTVAPATVDSVGVLEPEILYLDPDTVALIAEVDAILCAALTPTRHANARTGRFHRGRAARSHVNPVDHQLFSPDQRTCHLLLPSDARLKAPGRTAFVRGADRGLLGRSRTGTSRVTLLICPNSGPLSRLTNEWPGRLSPGSLKIQARSTTRCCDDQPLLGGCGTRLTPDSLNAVNTQEQTAVNERD
jgi:hypothetical protein